MTFLKRAGVCMPQKTESNWVLWSSLQRWPVSQTSFTYGKGVSVPHDQTDEDEDHRRRCVGFVCGIFVRSVSLMMMMMGIETTRLMITCYHSLNRRGRLTDSINREHDSSSLGSGSNHSARAGSAQGNSTQHAIFSQSMPPPIGHGSTAGPCIRTRVRCKSTSAPSTWVSILQPSETK